MLTLSIADIDSAVTRRDEFHIDSSVRLPLLDSDVMVMIALEPDHTTISDRQLACLSQLIAMGAERLNEVKEQLFDHFDQYDHFFDDDAEFNYESADQAFAASRLSFIYIDTHDSPWAPFPKLQFSVDWDPEHGASVYLVDDKFHWNPPSQT